MLTTLSCVEEVSFEKDCVVHRDKVMARRNLTFKVVH